MTLQVLKQKGESNRAIARRLSVSEGTIRYHLRRQAASSSDGRRKATMIEKLGLAAVVEHWWRTQRESLPEGRAVNVKELWHWLVEEHQYGGSYKSVWKHVRAQFPAPKLRPFRRIETPQGAQTQSDWLEANIDVGDSREKLYGFIMTLSHSRYSAVVRSRSMDQLAWHRVHNEALKRLGGVAAVNRIDNLKTGVSRGAGPWGEINACYRSYHQFSDSFRTREANGVSRHAVNDLFVVIFVMGFGIDAPLPQLAQQLDLAITQSRYA